MSTFEASSLPTAKRGAQSGSDPQRRNWFWMIFQTVMQLVFTVWLRFRARGIDELPRSGGALLLINHQSFLDPMLVGVPLSRPISFLARDTLFDVPIVGWVLRKTYVLPIDRDSAGTASIRTAIDRMRQGFLVGIFPEGTRSPDGSIGEFKPGFVALVRRAKVPVYPVGIAGAHEALPRDGYRLKIARVRLVIGAPFTPEEIEELAARGNEARFVREVRARIIACRDEAEVWRQR